MNGTAKALVDHFSFVSLNEMLENIQLNANNNNYFASKQNA